MDSKTLQRVSAEIARRFPEVAGCSATQQPRPQDCVLLTYRASKKTADGHKIARTIRALVNSDGEILKVTTSKSAG